MLGDKLVIDIFTPQIHELENNIVWKMGVTWICRETLVLRTWAEHTVGSNRIPWFPGEISQALDMEVWHTCTGIKHSENEHKLTIWVHNSMDTSPQSGCIWAQTCTPTQCERTFEGGVCLSYIDVKRFGAQSWNKSYPFLAQLEIHTPPYEFYSAEKEILN